MTTIDVGNITSPATGLLVFDTDLSAFYFYDGTRWTAVGALDGDWTESGNYWINMVDSFGIGTATLQAPLHAESTDVPILGVSSGTIGAGIYGQSLSSIGNVSGVYCESMSSTGAGVYGEASSASGATYGVSGISASSSGTGV